MRVKSGEEFNRIRIILKCDKKIKIKKYEKVNQNACKKRHKRVKYTELKNVKELTLTKRLGCRQAVRLRTLTPSSGSSNLSTPAKQKEQASACSFCFTCEAVKERFELRATPPGGKTVLRTVFSDDRRYLQSIGLNFRICFATIKRKISPPPAKRE